MSYWYVLIVGSCFIGPFYSRQDARDYRKNARATDPQFACAQTRIVSALGGILLPAGMPVYAPEPTDADCSPSGPIG